MAFGIYTIVDNKNGLLQGISTCPVCQTKHNAKSAFSQAIKTGMSFAHCGHSIFQVIKCNNESCDGRFAFRSNPDNPLINMRNFILCPHYDNPLLNSQEQYTILKQKNEWVDKLKFQYIPDWDDKNILQKKFFEHHKKNINPLFVSNMFMSESQFYELLNKEQQDKIFYTQRLYPNNSFYKFLLACIAPSQISEILMSGSADTRDGISHHDLVDKQKAVVALMKEFKGTHILETIKNKLKSKRLLEYSEKEVSVPDIFNRESLTVKRKMKTYKTKYIEQAISQILFRKLPSISRQLYQAVIENNHHEVSGRIFTGLFDHIYHTICTEAYLAEKRKELTKWTDKYKQGTALFIDAPMGLGKTYSIVEFLSSNENVSAIVFMPTKRLCEDLCENLAYKISIQNKYLPQPEDTYDVINTEGEYIFDEDGMIQQRFTREFLEKNGIYFFDGITKEECIHFEEIVERYHKNFFYKTDLCEHCSKKGVCRFLPHKMNAPRHRIPHRLVIFWEIIKK